MYSNVLVCFTFDIEILFKFASLIYFGTLGLIFYDIEILRLIV